MIAHARRKLRKRFLSSFTLKRDCTMEEQIQNRKVAFDNMVREVAKKLGKMDMDGIEVAEEVPDNSREKGGRKLLEYLQRQGKFSLWRTSGLRQILRDCERYDLAENEVKNYQLLFPDLESPNISRRSLTTSSSASSLPSSLSGSPRTRRRPRSSPASFRRRPGRLSLDHEARRLDTRYGSAQGLGSFSSSSSSEHSRGSGREWEALTADNSPLFGLRPFHSQASVNSRHHVELERSRLAIQALYQIATGSPNLCSSSSISSSNSEQEVPKRSHSKSFSMADEYKCDETLTASTLSRLLPRPRSSSAEPTDSPLSDKEEQKDTKSFPPTEVNVSPNIQSASTPANFSDAPVRSAKELAASINWQVMRERLLKSLTRAQDARPPSINCSQKIDLDVGQGRNNPRLSLILHPCGLFENRGKSASLQAKIAIPDKCPPLPPSLLVSLKLVVYSSHKQEIWRETHVEQPVNMHSFYIHHLFSCDIKPEAIGDYILLEISVTIKKG